MDIVAFRRRVLEIQAELETLDPTAADTADRARALGAELEDLAAERRKRTARRAARAFGDTVAPAGVEAPVQTLTSLVDRIQADSPSPTPTPEEPG